MSQSVSQKSKTTTNEEDTASMKGRHLKSEDLALKAYEAAVYQKGLDVLAFDVRLITGITDCVVICSGTSERHSAGIAEKVRLSLKESKEVPNSISGLERGEWIILDYSNVIVHVFHERFRQFYKLEDLWKEAEPLIPSEEILEASKVYRTKPIAS